MFREIGNEARSELGNPVAAQLRNSCDTSPSLEQAATQLQVLFDQIRDRDQRINDTIADYVRTCDNWTSYTRAGLHNIHLYLDTFICNPDGSATYILIDHALPRPDDETYSFDEKDAKIRQAIFGDIPHVNPDEELSEQDAFHFIVDTTKQANVTHFSSAAMEFFYEDAKEDTPLIDILRLCYARKPTIATSAAWPNLVDTHVESSRLNDILQDEITHAPVRLIGSLRSQDAAEHIRLAQHGAAHRAIEAKYHGDEYHTLINTYRYDTGLTEDERQAIAQRMHEILVANGHPDAHILNWPLVLEPFHAAFIEADTVAERTWDENVFSALVDNLSANGLFLYERAVRTRISAARTIEQLQLTTAAKQMGSQAIQAAE